MAPPPDEKNPPDLQFTNADPRLRPRSVPGPGWTFATEGNRVTHSYPVTEETFPTLFQDFMAMKQVMSSGPGFLEITDALSSTTLAESDGLLTRLRFSAICGLPYGRILMVLGHEYGHDWRALNPDAPPFLAGQEVPEAAREELEAGLIGLCLTRDKQAMLDWVKHGGHGRSPHYPNPSQLGQAVAGLQWSDCPVPAAPLSVATPSAVRQK
jgi:hypothetical protein